MRNRSRRCGVWFLGILFLVMVAGPTAALGSTGFMQIPIRWCAVQGTPAVLNSSCASEGSTKDVLWRRHERPTDSAYTPNCRVSFRSAAIAQQPSFPVIADPCDPQTDPACPGATGDIFVDPNNANFAEYYQVLTACASAWNTNGVGTIGLIGVNILRFVDNAGNPLTILGLGGTPAFSSTAQQMSLAGGFAVIDNDFTLPPPRGNSTSPCVAEVVNDPTDQVTGHEAGHALSLEHMTSTIMKTLFKLMTIFRLHKYSVRTRNWDRRNWDRRNRKKPGQIYLRRNRDRSIYGRAIK